MSTSPYLAGTNHLVNLSNSSFVSSLLNYGSINFIRLDGREAEQFRDINITYARSAYGQVSVSVGSSMVECVVSSSMVAPSPERPNEGILIFNTDYLPKSFANTVTSTTTTTNTNHAGGRGSNIGRLISTVIDKSLRRTRAVDIEGLCIIQGVQVWCVRCDLRILQDDGNLIDTASIAAIAALQHHRKREVEVDNGRIKIYSSDDREPLPLCLHHIPVIISVCCFNTNEYNEDLKLMVDLTAVEEEVKCGRICLAVNEYEEICSIHKPGGFPLSLETLKKAINIASVKSKIIINLIKESLEKDEQIRKLWRKNIHDRYHDPNSLSNCLAPIDVTPYL